MKLVFDDQLS